MNTGIGLLLTQPLVLIIQFVDGLADMPYTKLEVVTLQHMLTCTELYSFWFLG